VHQLATRSLLLDPLTHDDYGWLAGLYGDAEVMRYIGTGVRTEEQSRKNLDWLLGQSERLPFGYWVVRERGGGERLGGAILMVRREGAAVELGFLLARAAWGRGFATELARALVDHAFGELQLPELEAFTHPENAASAAVLRKAGLREAGPTTGPYGGPDLKFALTRAEWLSARP
jgi:RimJ/RimL family protein N-acetyltransferase